MMYSSTKFYEKRLWWNANIEEIKAFIRIECPDVSVNAKDSKLELIRKYIEYGNPNGNKLWKLRMAEFNYRGWTSLAQVLSVRTRCARMEGALRRLGPCGLTLSFITSEHRTAVAVLA